MGFFFETLNNLSSILILLGGVMTIHYDREALEEYGRRLNDKNISPEQKQELLRHHVFGIFAQPIDVEAVKKHANMRKTESIIRDSGLDVPDECGYADLENYGYFLREAAEAHESICEYISEHDIDSTFIVLHFYSSYISFKLSIISSYIVCSKT